MKKQTQEQTQLEEIELPEPLVDKANRLLVKIKDELEKEDIELYKFIEQVQFGPISAFSESAMEMPTFVFFITEGEVRPFPATQINAREIVIDFGPKYENMLKRVYGDNAQEDPRRSMLRRKFFCGVDAHKMILPREFFLHPGISPEAEKTLPKYIHARIFKMYMGEPFVRNFFTNDIVNKEEKWELLVEQNIAERIYHEETIGNGLVEYVVKNNEGKLVKQVTDHGEQLYVANTKIVHYKYKIRDEYVVSQENPVYDINSFDFVKSEFFEQEFSKMIVVAIRALYEEFDKAGPSYGLMFLGFGVFVLIWTGMLLYLMPGIISTSKKANGFIMQGIHFLMPHIGSLLHLIGL